MLHLQLHEYESCDETMWVNFDDIPLLEVA
jgi:hypothetical protein